MELYRNRYSCSIASKPKASILLYLYLCKHFSIGGIAGKALFIVGEANPGLLDILCAFDFFVANCGTVVEVELACGDVVVACGQYFVELLIGD